MPTFQQTDLGIRRNPREMNVLERRVDTVRVAAVIVVIQDGEIPVNRPTRNQIETNKRKRTQRGAAPKLVRIVNTRPVVSRRMQRVSESAGGGGVRESRRQMVEANRVVQGPTRIAPYLTRIFGRLCPTISFLPILKLEFFRNRFHWRSFLTVTRCRLARRQRLSPFLIRL